MASTHYNGHRLWRAGQQNTQVFGWKELLEEWNDSLTMPPAIQTVIDNLKAASDPLSNHNPTVNDFLRYFNWEQEGIKWFLYETIALRWMWGESRLDYVRETLNEVDALNSTFPTFPGSNTSQTIFDFLTTHLNHSEKMYLGLLPSVAADTEEESMSDVEDGETRSVEDAPINYLPMMRTPPRRTSSVHPHAPSRSSRASSAYPKIPPLNFNTSYPPVNIILARDNKKDHDDVITITKENTSLDTCYTIKYLDKTAKGSVSNKTVRSEKVVQCLTRQQVLQYLSISLRLLAEDEEPYNNVQILIPNMPVCLLPPKMDSYTRNLIYDSIEHTMNFWPVNDV